MQSSELQAAVRLSMRVGRRRTRAHSHAKSTNVFTQPQPLVCLIVKACTKTSFRGLVEPLAIVPAACETIGPRQLPDHSTLCKFAERKGVPAIVDPRLAELVKRVGADEWIVEAAADSTGKPTGAASTHFTATNATANRATTPRA